MTHSRLFTIPLGLLALAAAAAGCGSSSTTHPAAAPAGTTTASTTPPATAAGAFTAEAQAAAAGDIPDNQVFLAFRDAAGYSIRYPEGWLQRGSGPNVTFQDKSNRIRIVVGSGPAFTATSVKADLAALASTNASFRATAPTAVALPAGPAFKVSYSTESAPSPVTDKRVTLAVDRYYLAKGGRRAILDLGAPKGVDNVDAFRLIVSSFRWR
ncbi:MAG: hypothetical protein ACYDCH_07415 [Gaiellaceae bacterium]